jgi:hypothetical protein
MKARQRYGSFLRRVRIALDQEALGTARNPNIESRTDLSQVGVQWTAEVSQSMVIGLVWRVL